MTTTFKDYFQKDYIKSYFNNNKNGYDNPYVIHNDNLNLDINIYCNKMQDYKFPLVIKQINDVITNFVNLVHPERSEEKQIIKLNIFNDKNDYKEIGHDIGLGDEGGMHFYLDSGDQLKSEIFVFQRGPNILNLQHEIVHALCCYSVKERCELPLVLQEGIADFFAFSTDDKSDIQGRRIDEIQKIFQDKQLGIKDILNFEYSNSNAQDNSLVYSSGHVLMSYFQEKDSDFCKKLLESCSKGEQTRNLFIENHINDTDDFLSWLSNNLFDKSMQEINALKVNISDKIVTVEEVDRNGNNVEVTYYDAEIDKIDGNNVGQFSTAVQYFNFGCLRNYNIPTKDYIDLSKEFNFLKLVKDSSDNYKFINCDVDGNDYRFSHEYKKFSENIFAKYVNDNSAAKNILDKLTYINTDLIKGIDLNDSFMNNKIFAIKPSGLQNENMILSKSFHAASVYDDDIKVGELNTDVGYFSQSSGEEQFIYHDFALKLYTSYNGNVYIGVDLESGKPVASFIDSSKSITDKYHDELHIHRDELINPHIHNIDCTADVMLRGVKFLDDHESRNAQYTASRIDNGAIVEKSVLLDNKGTESTDDDVYGAQASYGGKVIHNFTNVGFYISQEGDFMIHDHGQDVRFQFPKEITHLKLVEHDGIKFVPCTVDGNEFPNRMPDGMNNYNDYNDEFRYINPLSAHKYEKLDYKNHSTNIGLINFNDYISEMGEPKFKITPNKDSKSTMTEVKLFHCKDGVDEEIGILANEYNQFRDNIFFSVDYNYSFSDFLASVSPNLQIAKLDDGTSQLYFDGSDGDVGSNNMGYTDHYRVYVDEIV